jgi:hypothetical protein
MNEPTNIENLTWQASQIVIGREGIDQIFYYQTLPNLCEEAKRPFNKNLFHFRTTGVFILATGLDLEETLGRPDNIFHARDGKITYAP